MPIVINGNWSDFGNILGAVSALGAAAVGLVDATKVYRGGISNVGFGFLETALAPYAPALAITNRTDPLATIRANWLNGVSKDDQKAKVKSLIHLGLDALAATDLEAIAPAVDAAAFAALVARIDSGETLSEQELALLGRFDTIVDAQLDAAFERADQKYRNSAKVLAGVFSIGLALLGVWIVVGSGVSFGDFALAALVGAVAIPLSPILKDLSSAVSDAAGAMKFLKG